MPRRKPGPAVLAVATLLMLAPAGALAAKKPSPNGRHAISINVSANPVVAGDPLLIYGRLTGPNDAGRQVTLWHRVNPAPRFTVVQRTQTDANGYYAFSRADGVVTSNRNWYVQSLGARSRTLHERVFALVTLNGPANGSTLETGPAHKVTFTGTVSQPNRAGQAVLLQRQSAATGGDDWRTIDHGRLGTGGTFSITHRFVDPGEANIRVLVRRTSRNLASPSSILEYQIDQAQNPALTIKASADPLTFGESVVFSGVVAGGASQPVTLLAHTDGQGFAPVAQVTTDAGGSYAFPAQTPINSTFYKVTGAGRSSAILFEGVKDALTAAVSATSVPAGQTVTFAGTVAPDKTGHVIYLQRKNATGDDFHTVQVARVAAGSTYTIVHRVFVPGAKVFRVRIPGGPENQGAVSAPFTVTVTPAPAASLPPAADGVTVGSTAGG
ncbi:MAG: hypothetical protein QOF77_410 [Solirubrobacteraceae bacterium]|jgi:hypothetical protein|nr:hypothetical protein [Solirubrobacteraceae bacterium]